MRRYRGRLRTTRRCKEMKSAMQSVSTMPAIVPVSRLRAMERGVVRVAPGVVLVLIAWSVVRPLRFTPSAVSNRIVDYSLLALMVPVAVAGMLLVVQGLRWMAMALWPARLEIRADEHAVTMRLGPIGSRRIANETIDLRYPFEMEGDPDIGDDVYESFLSPERQMASILPRMFHDAEKRRLDNLVFYYSGQDVETCIAALRPYVEYMRRGRPAIDTGDDDDGAL